MFNKFHMRKNSSSSGIDQPVSVMPSSSDQPSLPKQKRRISGSHRLSTIPKAAMKSMLAPPDVPKMHERNESDLPQEMIPVLTLLASHGSRVYVEGYFMILAELNNDGQPVPDRKWTEVYGTLQGTIITMWDAAQLDAGKYETTFINIADGYMRSVDNLGPELQNVIVLSTTMKNRSLLQFGTKKLFNEWTAALRLATFERTALQEAYTGALLSSKGSQLSGVRAMLAETRMKTEFWCNVRFGVGMPWKRVWVVILPNALIKSKKERQKRQGLGKVLLMSDPKDKNKKKPPLATIHQVSTAYAVFPEKAVLVNVSSLCKLECYVEFDGDSDVRESSVFLMPEQHPGIQGVETLIRTLIPLFDVFKLYGRPKRLNADKSDINSLLFGMPSLPRAYYLDVIDVFMLAAIPASSSWNSTEWSTKIKELIARKIAVGYKGSGSIHRSRSSSSASPSTVNNTPAGSHSPALESPSVLEDRKRAVSDPHGIPRLFDDKNSSTPSLNKYAPAMPSPLQHSRPAPKAPTPKGSPAVQTPTPTPPPAVVLPPPVAGSMPTARGGAPVQASAQPAVNSNGSSTSLLAVPGAVPRGPRAPPSAGNSHQRVKSEGEKVESGLLSPSLNDMQNGFGTERNEPFGGYGAATGAAGAGETKSPQQRLSQLTLNSRDSFASAVDNMDINRGPAPQSTNLFDPTHRPTHQSYAEYSEYMHQYLKKVPSHPPQQQQHSARDDISGGGIATAVEVDGDSEEDDSTDNIGYPAFAKNSERPSTPQDSKDGTRLLSTPIRTPVYTTNQSPDGSADAAIKEDPSPPRSTALNAPRMPVYPNAPGSPGGKATRSNDSLHAPNPGYNNEQGQRRPSGPREFPSPSKAEPIAQSRAGPTPSTAQVPQTNPFARPPQSSGAPQQQPQPQYGGGAPPPPQQQHSGFQHPGPQYIGGPQHPGSQQQHQQQQGYRPGPGPQYPPGQYPPNQYPPPGIQQSGQQYSPRLQGPGGQFPPQFSGGPPNARQQPGHPAGYPGAQAPPNRYNTGGGPMQGGPVPGGPMGAGPMGGPMGGPRNPYAPPPSQSGYNGPLPNGMPATGMPVNAGPRPVPAQGYGLRKPMPPASHYQPNPVDPNGAAGTDKANPRSFNEARAQQLKSMRAQAMGDGTFGI